LIEPIQIQRISFSAAKAVLLAAFVMSGGNNAVVGPNEQMCSAPKGNPDSL